MTRLNILLDEDIHKKFKAKCALEGITMTDFLQNKIKEYVRKK